MQVPLQRNDGGLAKIDKSSVDGSRAISLKCGDLEESKYRYTIRHKPPELMPKISPVFGHSVLVNPVVYRFQLSQHPHSQASEQQD